MTHASLALTIPLGIVLLLPAIAAAAAARGGWSGSLRRTGRLGVHTIAAGTSDRAFALANKVAAPVVAGAAGIGLVAAVMVLGLPLSTAAAIVVFGLGLLGLFVLLYAAAAVGERAARALPPPARRPGSGQGCAGAAGKADAEGVDGALSCGACDCGGAGCSAQRRSLAPLKAGTAPTS